MQLDLTPTEVKALRRILKHSLKHLDDMRSDDWGFAEELLKRLRRSANPTR